MNHGPEKTPHTDPDHPHEGSAAPDPAVAPEPELPARPVGDAVDGPGEPDEEDPEERGPAAGPAPAEDAEHQHPGTTTDTEARQPAPTAGAEDPKPGAEDPASNTGAEDSSAGPSTEDCKTAPSAVPTVGAEDRKLAPTADKADRKPVPGTAPTAGAEDPKPGAPAGGDGEDALLATLTSIFAAEQSTGPSTAPRELDEVALRGMLQGAVRDLRPADGVLDHLHRAVPARRARRRQAVVGTAAAALLIGTAVPAFVHVATSNDASTARPAIAGHGEQAQGGNGDGAAPDAPDLQTAEPTDRRSEGVTGEADPDPSPTKGEGGDPDGTATAKQPDPSAVDYAMLPVCDPGQLGVASAGTGAPGADGTVYGSFKIANVSGKDCTVSSNGTVGFTALGAADPLKIGVVQHAAGDAAPGLPDPSQEPGTVVLKPTMAYEVRFAWVPADTCPTTGPSPSPTPSADGAGGSVGDGTDQSGTAAQSLTEDGGTAEGSIAVTHTPEAGAPTAETKIPNACSGTIYRTGVLATS
ncbi:hypothetical protein ACH415_04590 [Streptomyces californicus]|uniref:hypothetical protein n=1 Tax=Streptomyces californicus TaxID=67351 RepID=UPI0037987E79